MAPLRVARRPARPQDVGNSRYDPEQLGLNLGSLPGGRFLRGHLHGEPPEIYRSIGPGFDELETTAGGVDRSRPLVDFYKRNNEIELWLPVAD